VRRRPRLIARRIASVRVHSYPCVSERGHKTGKRVFEGETK
jgi:hypothetical protein